MVAIIVAAVYDGEVKAAVRVFSGNVRVYLFTRRGIIEGI